LAKLKELISIDELLKLQPLVWRLRLSAFRAKNAIKEPVACKL